MVAIGWRQILSILALNIFTLWLTYGYFISLNPLTVSSLQMFRGCVLSVDFPESLHYGHEITMTGKLSCIDRIHEELLAQAILICGDLSSLTVNTTRIREDGMFILKLNPSFQKPPTDKVLCSLTVQIISKTVSTELIEKKTLAMFVAS